MKTRSGKCVFCGETATQHNEEEQPVCRRHRDREPKDVSCDDCGLPMEIKRSRKGSFWGCVGYPQCQNTYKIEHKLEENE